MIYSIGFCEYELYIPRQPLKSHLTTAGSRDDTELIAAQSRDERLIRRHRG